MKKTTKIYDVSALTEERLREAQVLRDPDAMRETDEALAMIRKAAAVIRGGGIVAFPTETVYGLGANAFDKAAVSRIYEAKGRPSDNPMIIHIARASDIGLLAKRCGPEAVRLADAFWPGPLTMIFEKREDVPTAATGGLDTVGVRLPDSLIASELIRAAGTPLAAPSANISGSPSPTKAEHVIADLDGKADVILVGPDCRIGIESTVVDMTSVPPQILRPGYLTADDLAQVSGAKVTIDPALLRRAVSGDDSASGIAPKSPGMKYRHYAPKAEMIVIEGARTQVERELHRLKAMNEYIGRVVGTILFEEKDYVEAAHDFYARLRELDDEGADLILAGALAMSDGLGFAVMNRMMKAAGYNIVKV